MQQTIELDITGMTCGNCVSHVNNALRGVVGVENTAVDLASGKATITGYRLDNGKLIEAVEEEGYEAKVVGVAP